MSRARVSSRQWEFRVRVTLASPTWATLQRCGRRGHSHHVSGTRSGRSGRVGSTHAHNTHAPGASRHDRGAAC
eukprot:7339653-Prymnesium_polylepis.1